jgi:hypothetical protein
MSTQTTKVLAALRVLALTVAAFGAAAAHAQGAGELRKS